MKKIYISFFFGNHTISIYENCVTSIFLMATTHFFKSKNEIALNFFLNRKSDFEHTFSKKNFYVHFPKQWNCMKLYDKHFIILKIV